MISKVGYNLTFKNYLGHWIATLYKDSRLTLILCAVLLGLGLLISYVSVDVEESNFIFYGSLMFTSMLLGVFLFFRILTVLVIFVTKRGLGQHTIEYESETGLIAVTSEDTTFELKKNEIKKVENFNDLSIIYNNQDKSVMIPTEAYNAIMNN